MDSELIAPLVVVFVIIFVPISVYFCYHAYHKWKIRESIKAEQAVNEAFESENRRIKADLKEMTLDLKKQLDAALEKSENDYQNSAFDFTSNLFHRAENGELPGIADTVTIINHLSEPDVITAIVCYDSNIVNALYYNAKYHLGHFPQEGEEYHDVFKRYTDALEYGVHALPEIYEVLHREELISDYEKDGCTKAEAIQLAEQKIHNEKILKQVEQNIMLQKKQIEMTEEQKGRL